MLDYLQKAKQYLWAFVEIGFLAVLSVILIYLILGPDSSGVFVSGVADNVLKLAAALPPQSLVGLAIVLALVILLTNRMRYFTCRCGRRGVQACAASLTGTPLSLSSDSNSPAWNISRTMSQPPTNSPLT